MITKHFRTEGVILKRSNFGETDKIITVFTKDDGKIKALARGIRKINSRRAPYLELFNQVVLFLYKGRNFDIITDVKIIKGFNGIRKDLQKTALAFYIGELVDKLTVEGQKSRWVYELLISCYNDLNHCNKDVKELAKRFAVRLFEELGFWPRNKPAQNLDIDYFVERIIEGKLKSKRFLEFLNH